MTWWKALGIGLPIWTLLMLAVLMLTPWAFHSPACLPRTIGGGLSPGCAASLTTGNIAIFYLQLVPMAAAWLGGYAFVCSRFIRARRSRAALVAAWLIAVLVFAVIARPLPVQPYPGG